jgi:hypothetical protein
MNILSDSLDTVSESIDFVLKPLVEQQSVFTFVSLFLILYGSMAKPKLPVMIRQLFDYSIFRFIILSLILWRSNKDIKSSLLLAIGFVLTMQILNKQKTEDMIDNIIYKQYNIENFTENNENIIPNFNYNCNQFNQLMSELNLKKTEAEIKCLTHDDRIKNINLELNKTENQIKGPLICEKNLIECNKNKGENCSKNYFDCLKSIN